MSWTGSIDLSGWVALWLGCGTLVAGMFALWAVASLGRDIVRLLRGR